MDRGSQGQTYRRDEAVDVRPHFRVDHIVAPFSRLHDGRREDQLGQGKAKASCEDAGECGVDVVVVMGDPRHSLVVDGLMFNGLMGGRRVLEILDASFRSTSIPRFTPAQARAQELSHHKDGASMR